MKLPENASSRRARPWLGRGGSLVVCTPAAVALLEAVLHPQEGQLFDRDGAGRPPIVDLPAEATLPGGSTAATSRKVPPPDPFLWTGSCKDDLPAGEARHAC